MSEFRSILNARGYEVGPRLGAGGEAAVYRVRHRSRHSYAVKVYQKPIDDDGALRRRFDKELEVLVALQGSQYVVRLQESFDEGGYLFTVWELADGTIRSLLEQRQRDGDGSFSRDECQQLLLNVAKGLDAIHARSGVHCDIKPENLLVFDDEHLTTDDPVVKISDFGTARIIESETTHSAGMRTPQYSLPGRHVGTRKRERDLFSLAVVYAELRLGRHPYGATSEEILKNLHTNKPQLEGLDDDEVAEVKPVLCDAATPESAVKWLRGLAPVQMDAGLSLYKILRSDLQDAMLRLEAECERRFRNDPGRPGNPPKSSALIRSEPLFHDHRLMSERNLSLKIIFSAIDVRNDVAHRKQDSHDRTLDDIREATAVLSNAADLLDGKGTKQRETLPPQKGTRNPPDDEGVDFTSTGNTEQPGPAPPGCDSDPDLIKVCVPEGPHNTNLKVETICAAIGSNVQEGDLLVSLDGDCPFAMADPVRSPSAGWIHSIEVKTGSRVNAGDTVVVLSTAEPPASETSTKENGADSDFPDDSAGANVSHDEAEGGVSHGAAESGYSTDSSPQSKSHSAVEESAGRRHRRGGKSGTPVLIKAVVAVLLITGVVFYLRSTSRAIAIAHALDEFDFETALTIDDKNPDALIARAESRLDQNPPDVEAAEADLDQVESSDRRHQNDLEIARLKIELIGLEQSGADAAAVADRKNELAEKLISRCLAAKVSVHRDGSLRWEWRQIFEDYRSLALLGVTDLDHKTGSLINDPQMPDEVREQLLQELHPVYNSIGMQFRLLPAGVFTMGYSDAVKHNVDLSSDIFMGVYEVTADQYQHVMGPGETSQKGSLPVQGVTWNKAGEFCNRLSSLPEEMASGRRYRLPTEAEWEYACRAGSEALYSFGSDETELGYFAWFAENADRTPHPVGTKLPNPWGFYDMHGNVWEWCEDVWRNLRNENVTDPLSMPVAGLVAQERVMRGGSFACRAGFCRSGHRDRNSADSHADLGFRVVMVQSDRGRPEIGAADSNRQIP